MSQKPTLSTKIDRMRSGTRILGNQLARANTHLHFFRGLLLRYGELSKAQDFWDYTLAAHSGMTIRDLGVICDTHKLGINLINLLAQVDTPLLDSASHQKLLRFRGVAGKPSTNPRVTMLREWRNNIVAHYNDVVAANDRDDFWNQNPLGEVALQTLIDTGFEIVEWCGKMASVSSEFPRFANGKNGHFAVLDSLKALT